MIYRNLALITLVFLLLSVPLSAQQKNRYTRMRGKMGENVDVTGNFQRTGSSVEGNYSYNIYVDDSLVHLSPVITLYGDIDKRNKVVLRKVSGNDTAMVGLFSDHRFSGFWHAPDSSALWFDLNESYEKGSLPLAIFYLHSDKQLVPKIQDSPSAEIELTLLYPKNNAYIPEKVADSIKKFIQKQFFGQYKPAVLPSTLLEQDEANFYTRFNEFNSHWKSNRKMGLNLEKRENMNVVFNGYNLLCLQYKKRGYAGRGNPMEHLSYDMIDLRNGEKLSPENIFKPDSKKAIFALINKKIREDNDLNDTASLKKIGFFTDSIPISRNIRFNGNGLFFVYNVYDVAPPAFGVQKIFLPFSQIGPFIKPSCVLYRLAQ